MSSSSLHWGLGVFGVFRIKLSDLKDGSENRWSAEAVDAESSRERMMEKSSLSKALIYQIVNIQPTLLL